MNRSRQKNVLCKFYKYGHCIKGEACPYRHSKRKRKSKRQIGATCKFYLMGKCVKGNNCSFSHNDYPQPQSRADFMQDMDQHHDDDFYYASPPAEPAYSSYMSVSPGSESIGDERSRSYNDRSDIWGATSQGSNLLLSNLLF